MNSARTEIRESLTRKMVISSISCKLYIRFLFFLLASYFSLRHLYSVQYNATLFIQPARAIVQVLLKTHRLTAPLLLVPHPPPRLLFFGHVIVLQEKRDISHVHICFVNVKKYSLNACVVVFFYIEFQRHFTGVTGAINDLIDRPYSL